MDIERSCDCSESTPAEKVQAEPIKKPSASKCGCSSNSAPKVKSVPKSSPCCGCSTKAVLPPNIPKTIIIKPCVCNSIKAKKPSIHESTEPPSTTLGYLKLYSKLVTTSDILSDYEKYRAEDAMTNPVLILTVAHNPDYQPLIDKAIEFGKGNGATLDEQSKAAAEYLTILFSAEILKIIPGCVSVEVDARLSYDIDATVKKALEIIKHFSSMDIPKERILIKIAATWEGIKAGKILQSEHEVNCNLILIFNLIQAVTCAEANIAVISPFVGRVFDWYVKHPEVEFFKGCDEPGIKLVTDIYNYLKKFDYDTVINCASFRSSGEIKCLAGCDALTIPVKFLEELNATQDEVSRVLSPDTAKAEDIEKIDLSENLFRWKMTEDPLVSDQLNDGLRRFALVTVELETYFADQMKPPFQSETLFVTEDN